MNKFRHLKVLDLLDKEGIKPLETLKDELGLLILHYLSYSRLVIVIRNIEKVYPELKLKSKIVDTPVETR